MLRPQFIVIAHHLVQGFPSSPCREDVGREAGRRHPCFVQAVVPQGELQELVQSYPAYSYVVDFSGDVVAALVSRPLKVMPCMLSRGSLARCSMQLDFVQGGPAQ